MATLPDLLYLTIVLLIVQAVSSVEGFKVLNILQTHNARQHNVYNETSVYQDCTNACNFTDQRVECLDCLLKDVPPAAHHVVLLRFNQSRFVPKMFCGVSWPNVAKLTILNTDDGAFGMDNFIFTCLPNIKTLKLGLRSLSNLSHSTFYGLDDLTTLDLTDCIRLEIPGLVTGLSAVTNAPKLQNIVLSNVGSAYGGLQITQEFIDILAYRRVSNIDFSSSTVGCANPHVHIDGLCESLERVNLANTFWSGPMFVHPSSCDSLREIDFSGYAFPGSSNIVGNITIPQGVVRYDRNRGWISALSSVSKLHMNRLISTDHYIVLDNVTFSIKANNSLREIHSSGYSLPVFEAVLILEPNHLEYFDLSNNKIQRLSQNTFAYLEHLKIIDLSNNLLSASRRYENTVSYVFRNNSKLEIIKMTQNGLTYLPPSVFNANKALKQIDLSSNKITQITFQISHLYNLDVLDLRGNEIDYLNDYSRQQIDILYRNKQERLNTTDDKPFTVDLRDNIFSCKCHSIDFIKWFIQSPVFKGSRDIYNCIADGKLIPMDKGAIEAAQYDCDKPKRKLRRLLLIVLLPCVSTGILVTLAIITFKRYKKHRLYRILREHIDLIHEDQLQHKFPVFLSYASEDSEFVESNILRPLEVSFSAINEPRC